MNASGIPLPASIPVLTHLVALHANVTRVTPNLEQKCELRQCKISGTCYAYGAVNPSNQCQVRLKRYQPFRYSFNYSLRNVDFNLPGFHTVNY